ncbi:unnamed protein product [Dibothriocephalus latus]|uniref:Endonuclease/exonuclease/phosphatase domain-containing protein n=1 Tax=Dibothriocephalus latus TaxID=60516 RepID=A0A3P7LZ08_DIBLA|nr:unnamed protein product [Dibothriocephalus latus]
MQRVLLSLDLHFSPTQLLPTNRKAATASSSIRMRLWTSHLESCANFAEERMCQLRQSWKEMIDSLFAGNPASLEPFYGIFCGDLNIRDKEVSFPVIFIGLHFMGLLSMSVGWNMCERKVILFLMK